MTPPTPGQPTLHELTQRIKDQALAVGFDLVGVAPVQESPELAFFERWLDAGYAGEMHYLQRSRERRHICNRFCREHNQSWYVASTTTRTLRIRPR